MEEILQTNCPELKLLARGKVRDIFEIDSEHLLFVATDRLSAFDVVMTNGIPGKGKILTQLSVFWFKKLANSIPNHFVTSNIDEMPQIVQKYRVQLEGRCLLVKKLKVLPVEAIVRGYIAGSGWSEYQSRGTVCDIKLPVDLEECQKLPTPLFTPSTKAAIGDHDENIHPDKCAELIGKPLAAEMERAAISLYEQASEYAASRGIIIADTKFEFGVDQDSKLFLVDEILTPDSSRFWPSDKYKQGKSQPSFDKQFVRDYLTRSGFNKKDPVALPQEIVSATLEKYIECFRILTGQEPKL